MQNTRSARASSRKRRYMQRSRKRKTSLLFLRSARGGGTASTHQVSFRKQLRAPMRGLALLPSPVLSPWPLFEGHPGWRSLSVTPSVCPPRFALTAQLGVGPRVFG